MQKTAGILAALLLMAGVAQAETLTLSDSLNRARATNLGLKATSYEETMAQDQIDVARSARLPRVDLQAGYTAQQAAQGFSLGPVSAETQDPDYAFLNFSIYQTLYDFGRTKTRIEEAQLQRQAAHYGYSGAEQDLFLQVVRAYFGVLEAKKLVEAANDELAQMTAHRKTAQALFDEGVVTRNDLLQAEVRVAAARQKLLAAQNQVENGWLNLDYLIGATPGFRAELTEDFRIGGMPAAGERVDFSNRAEIQAQRQVVSIGDLAVKEAKTNYYPEFFLRLALDYQQNSKVTEPAIMSATVGFKVNLFDGLATTARVREAVKARSRDEARLRDLETRVALELASAQNDLRVAKERITVAEKAIEQGVENLRITRDRYQEKVGTATDVVDAQTLLTQTRVDYFQSMFDYQVAAARVKRAIGEL
ncbi:TolC family protein [Geomesophilobacter sediminis]|uniref:TolC family protein n=1 Tax=Geomesophilobacter sediminis TaxID=2798584 RepID=A0A8J7JBV2_9BACT|nr:TolC family protein [Geomesophilobacter sediminis]MBJ6724103.1 TolC family protein [Geomesophilobacter sediminis]